MEILITPAQKRGEVRFGVDNLQVIASEEVENESGRNRVRFQWMENANSTSDLEHITYDEGRTYEQIHDLTSLPNPANKLRVALEDNPEKLSRLRRIWVEYKKLGKNGLQRVTVHSAR